MVVPSWSEVGHSEFIYPSCRDPSCDSQRHARMEVLKEKVEEEEAAEREAEAEKGEKMVREVRKEETTMTPEMLRELEKKLSDIEITVPEKPL